MICISVRYVVNVDQQNYQVPNPVVIDFGQEMISVSSQMHKAASQ